MIDFWLTIAICTYGIGSFYLGITVGRHER